MSENNSGSNIAQYIIPGGVVVGVLLFGKNILEYLNIIDDKDDKQKQEENKNIASKNYWDPQFWKDASTGHNIVIIKADMLAELISHLRKAQGNFNDNEDLIYGAFRMIHTHTQLSYLCDGFLQETGKDLLGYLYGGGGGLLSHGILNDSEFNTVATIVSKYTSGIS